MATPCGLTFEIKSLARDSNRCSSFSTSTVASGSSSQIVLVVLVDGMQSSRTSFQNSFTYSTQNNININASTLKCLCQRSPLTVFFVFTAVIPFWSTPPAPFASCGPLLITSGDAPRFINGGGGPIRFIGAMGGQPPMAGG